MSKSQSRDVFACDDARVTTAGPSAVSADAGQELFHRDKAFGLTMAGTQLPTYLFSKSSYTVLLQPINTLAKL